jgi:hypothetical protein
MDLFSRGFYVYASSIAEFDEGKVKNCEAADFYIFPWKDN